MILKLFFSLSIGIAAGLIVTEIASRWVFFSLFLGIPAGIAAAAIMFVLLNLRVKQKKTEYKMIKK
jgi:putative effector of murein hydrolase LrgA (UPF0299 family)